MEALVVNAELRIDLEVGMVREQGESRFAGYGVKAGKAQKWRRELSSIM